VLTLTTVNQLALPVTEQYGSVNTVAGERIATKAACDVVGVIRQSAKSSTPRGCRTMPTTYTVPDNPADVEAAVLGYG
jgi:hypothetical protein